MRVKAGGLGVGRLAAAVVGVSSSPKALLDDDKRGNGMEEGRRQNGGVLRRSVSRCTNESQSSCASERTFLEWSASETGAGYRPEDHRGGPTSVPHRRLSLAEIPYVSWYGLKVSCRGINDGRWRRGKREGKRGTCGGREGGGREEGERMY
jgi:hypothetical protein